MIRFLKNWTLPLAMIVGGLGYKWIQHLSFLTPWLIFTMLLLTFCKIEPKDLKIRWQHVWLLLIQIPGSLVVYLLIAPFNPIVAQGTMISIMAPTATAAAVITGKLGGNIASITTYTLLANILTAVTVPAIFPLIEQGIHPDFWNAFATILSRIFPLLISPFIIALLFRYFLPKTHAFLLKINGLAFYLWALAIIIVTGQTVVALIESASKPATEILIGTTALMACGLQFYLGKAIGTKYGDRIACGQSLGQKNTILAIWMAHTYLNPVAAIGPGTYVLWQNIVNSYQLWKKRNKSKSTPLK